MIPIHHYDSNGRKVFGPYNSNVFRLMNDALSKFVDSSSSLSASKMKVNRVVDFDALSTSAKQSYIKLMRKQTYNQCEVDGWLNLSGRKMIILGKYIREEAKEQVQTKNSIQFDVKIDASLGLDFVQFERLFLTLNRAQSSACELKLLIDSMIDAGERLYFTPPIVEEDGRLTTKSYRVIGADRAECWPIFAWNPFMLVDPKLDPNLGNRQNDAAFATRFGEIINPDKKLSQTLVRLNLEVPGKHEPMHWLFDPTYMQVQKNCSFNINVHPFQGPGLDIDYADPYSSRPSAISVLAEPQPFSIRDMFHVVNRIEPPPKEGDLCVRLFHDPTVWMGMINVISIFTGTAYAFEKLDLLMADIGCPHSDTKLNAFEQRRREAYYSHLSESLAEEKAKEQQRKERAAQSRAEAAAKGEKPFTVTLPQVGIEKPFRRRQQTQQDKLKHHVHTAQKPIMQACFDKKQVNEHDQAEERKAKEKHDGMAKLERDIQKEIAAKQHYVPAPAKLSDFVDSVLKK